MGDLYLVLENGAVFKGRAFGAEGEVTAEVVFTTGMTGYPETLTDRCYYGQTVVQTFPLIGNYGVINSELENIPAGCAAYIVRDFCRCPSNFRSEGDIETFLKSRGIVGLYGIDTRALTRMLREYGVMNGKITKDPDNVDWNEIKNYRIKNAVEKVTCREKHTVSADGGKHRAAMLDFGGSVKITSQLVACGCELTVYPATTDAVAILADKPDGVILSDGPGNPADPANRAITENIRELLKAGIPVLGIGIGHQLLAQAFGIETYKLKYGHRGANQPVRDVETGRVYITSQNHGYAVSSDGGYRCDGTLCDVAKELFVNVNDRTCEGLLYNGKGVKALSAQFTPEACTGPQDTSFVYEKFISYMDSRSK